MEKVVVVDAGHGGRDSGALGNGRKEKDITLDFARELNRRLNNIKGVRSYLTRDTDKYIGLTDRKNIGNKKEADVFVSLHLNAFRNPNANGVETFYFTGSIKGNKLATAIQKELVALNLFRNRGVKQNTFTVLTGSPISSLIELGFITNKKDLNNLLNNKNTIIEAIIRGILSYLNISYTEGIEEEKEGNKGDLKPNKEISEVNVSIDGSDYLLEGLISDGKSYVELRRLLELIGVEVGWDSKERKVLVNTINKK